MRISTVNILQMVIDIVNVIISILPSNMKFYIYFQMLYLHSSLSFLKVKIKVMLTSNENMIDMAVV